MRPGKGKSGLVIITLQLTVLKYLLMKKRKREIRKRKKRLKTYSINTQASFGSKMNRKFNLISSYSDMHRIKFSPMNRRNRQKYECQNRQLLKLCLSEPISMKTGQGPYKMACHIHDLQNLLQMFYPFGTQTS